MSSEPSAPNQAQNAVCLALTTCPNQETATRIAEALVTERLATCVNQLPNVRSTYFWDGRLQNDDEILLMIKTTLSQVRGLESRLKAVHPYELPELIVLPVIAGNEAYLRWVREGVAKGTDE
jgi:periplasmic divalent cation tolerance protein